jgi:nicotinate-nucleotide adenylyltransferase
MIGVLGGTFNPIHFGHLRPALELVEALRLDHLRLIPSGLPPHREAPQVGARERLAMVEVAAAGEAAFVVDDRELRREGPSYTLDTLKSLREEFPQQPMALIVGADAFREFDTWHEWRSIIDYAHIVVMQRPLLLPTDAKHPQARPPMSAELQAFVAAHRVESIDALHVGRHGCILNQNVTQLDISATRIRELIGAGKSARYLMPDSVWRLICDKGFYRNTV